MYSDIETILISSFFFSLHVSVQSIFTPQSSLFSIFLSRIFITNSSTFKFKFHFLVIFTKSSSLSCIFDLFFPFLSRAQVSATRNAFNHRYTHLSWHIHSCLFTLLLWFSSPLRVFCPTHFHTAITTSPNLSTSYPTTNPSTLKPELHFLTQPENPTSPTKSHPKPTADIWWAKQHGAST